MVKHTQATRPQTTDELPECAWPPRDIAAQRAETRNPTKLGKIKKIPKLEL